ALKRREQLAQELAGVGEKKGGTGGAVGGGGGRGGGRVFAAGRGVGGGAPGRLRAGPQGLVLPRGRPSPGPPLLRSPPAPSSGVGSPSGLSGSRPVLSFAVSERSQESISAGE